MSGMRDDGAAVPKVPGDYDRETGEEMDGTGGQPGSNRRFSQNA